MGQSHYLGHDNWANKKTSGFARMTESRFHASIAEKQGPLSPGPTTGIALSTIQGTKFPNMMGFRSKSQLRTYSKIPNRMEDNLKTYLPGTEVDFLGKDSPPKYYSPISGSKVVQNRYKHRAEGPKNPIGREKRGCHGGIVALGLRAVEIANESPVPGPGIYNISRNLSIS